MENAEKEEIQEIQRIILDNIELSMKNDKTYKIKNEKGRIKEEVKQATFDFDRHSNISKEALEEVFANYDRIFDDLFELIRYKSSIIQFIQKAEKEEQDNNDKTKMKQQIKQQVKKKIQSTILLESNELSKGLEKILENYDLIFDWVYDKHVNNPNRKLEELQKRMLYNAEKEFEPIKQLIEASSHYSEDVEKKKESIRTQREEFLESIRPKEKREEKPKEKREEKLKEEKKKSLKYMTMYGRDDINYYSDELNFETDEKDKKNKKKIEIMPFMQRNGINHSKQKVEDNAQGTEEEHSDQDGR